MRQLNISKQPPGPTREAESARALPFLQQLAAARPLGLPPAEEARLLRFLGRGGQAVPGPRRSLGIVADGGVRGHA